MIIVKTNNSKYMMFNNELTTMINVGAYGLLIFNKIKENKHRKSSKL